MKLRVEVQRSTGKDSHRETEETMLRIVVEHSMGSAVLCCFGRIIAGKEALSLRDAVMCQVDKRSVVLDLAGVEFIDAAGLGLLVFLHTLAAAVGFDLQILNPIHRVAKLLELTRLDSVLEIRLSDEMEVQSSFITSSNDGHFTGKFESSILIKDESISQPESA